MLFVGDDWAEDHHDVELQDEQGRVLARARLPEGIAGITRLHALIGQFAGPDTEPVEVAVGIETDRGLWVTALRAAGYTVYAVNPRQVSRYRERQAPPAPRATRATRTPWPTWSEPTPTSCGRWPGTAPRPRPSRWPPGPTRR